MKVVADFSVDCRSVILEKTGIYYLIDFETGQEIGIYKGSDIIKEYDNDTEQYVNVSKTPTHYEFYNIWCKKSLDGKYRCVYIDTANLKVIKSTFDELIIAAFKCADRYYFRVDKWIWEIEIDSDSLKIIPDDYRYDINDKTIWGVYIGAYKLDWIHYSDCQSMLITVESIIYDKDRNRISFTINSALSYENDSVADKINRVRLTSGDVEITLDDGYMMGFTGYQGIDLDEFNKNLVFGG